MKRFLLALLMLFFFATSVNAQIYLWRYRTHATDCTALTDGKNTDLCYEQDSSTVYKCVPSAGDCSGAEWKAVEDVVDTDTNTTPSDSDWTVHGSYPAACSAGQYISALGDTSTCGAPTTISGNAGTATALAADPADCGAGTCATAIAASGALTCSITPLVSGGTLTSGYVCRYDGTGIDCDRLEDGSGDCASNSVCMGGHTHSTYYDALTDMTLANTYLYVGNASNNPVGVAMSGDATITNLGAVAVADDSHAHTTTTVSGLDVSADTNLTAGDALTLTDDDLDFDGGATPGGSLGGTWASPTVDDLFVLNSTSDVMTGTLTADGLTLGANETIQLGAQTLLHDATDFVFNDTIKVGGSSSLVVGAVTWNSGDNINGESIADDTIDDDSLDFGTGADQISAADLTFAEGDITDSTIISADIKNGDITVADTAITAGRSLTWSTNDMVADAELYTDTKCFYLKSPVATDDFKSIFYAKQALTITSLWCESDQTTTMMFQVDDGSAADVDETDLTCDSTPPEDTSLNGDATMAAGDRLDIDLVSVSGTPTWASMCITFTLDD